MIRPGTDDDAVAVVPLLRAAHKAKGLDRIFAFNAATAMRRWRAYLTAADTLCLVHEIGGRVRGVFVGIATDYPDAPGVRLAVERAVWVDPAYRGMAWFRMLREFEVWAQARGCRAIAQTGKDDPRFAAAIERRGYASFETHFLKVL